jgi:biopolymer transport protein ExbB
MNVTELFLDFARLGAEWVLWLLVALSVASIAVMIDRAMWFRRRDSDTGLFARDLKGALERGALPTFCEQHQASTAIPVQVALAGLADLKHGPEAAAEAMHAERARWRRSADRNLIVLGTLGNNVPFVGLFGTVLGVINAFDSLATQTSADVSAVMAHIAEALVATAIGLLVAIPAVIAYNYFNRRLKVIMGGADELAHVVLGIAHGRAGASATKAASEATR